jgi:hypothetical protein
LSLGLGRREHLGPLATEVSDHQITRSRDHQITRFHRVTDPVVADDGAGRAVLQIVAAGAGLRGAEIVELIDDAERFGVCVVLEETADVAVVVDRVAFDQDVARDVRFGRDDEDAVAGVVQIIPANDDVLAFFDSDRGSVVDVRLRAAAVVGKRVWRTRRAHVEVLDRDGARHRVGGNAGAADLDHRALLTPVVEARAAWLPPGPG